MNNIDILKREIERGRIITTIQVEYPRINTSTKLKPL